MSKAKQYAEECRSARDRKVHAEKELQAIQSKQPQFSYESTSHSKCTLAVSEHGNLAFDGNYSVDPLTARRMAEWILATFTEL